MYDTAYLTVCVAGIVVRYPVVAAMYDTAYLTVCVAGIVVQYSVVAASGDECMIRHT